jgi:hypothetical protein
LYIHVNVKEPCFWHPTNITAHLIKKQTAESKIGFESGFLEYISCFSFDFWTVEAPNPFP